MKDNSNPYLEFLYTINELEDEFDDGIWKKNEIIIDENINKLEALEIKSSFEKQLLKRLKKLKEMHSKMAKTIFNKKDSSSPR